MQTIFISAIFCLLTPIGSAVTQTWEQLFIARLLMGIGMGLKGSSVPIFAAENSPARIRGALVMSWQMWTVCWRCDSSHPEKSVTDYMRWLGIWDLLGLLCESRRVPGRGYRLASSTRLGFHPCSSVSSKNSTKREARDKPLTCFSPLGQPHHRNLSLP